VEVVAEAAGELHLREQVVVEAQRVLWKMVLLEVAVLVAQLCG